MRSLSLLNNVQTDKALRFQNALHAILDQAIEADYAVLGNIQLLNAKRGTLQIVAQRGFDLAFLQHFESVFVDDGCCCARVLSKKARVVISDVTKDPDFSPYVPIAQASGFRAVQSTPLFQRGVFRGVLSTHFPDVHHLSDHAIATLDDCAEAIVALLESGIDSV